MSMTAPFDKDLIRRYEGPGPRYTSYPTAVQFTEEFTRDDYRALCERSNTAEPRKPLAAYVHVPFCASLCYYCACSKIVTRHPEKVRAYLERLHREIEMQSGLLESGRPLRQLHFGGGTPTYLSAQQMAQLMRALESSFGFAAPSEREFSIEIDPRTLGPNCLPTLREQGFDRVSFGVQDLDPRVQAAINRLQPVEMTLAAIEGARSAGFGALSLDLIYGLPHQSVASFSRTLDQIIAARPERLAVYNYAHLPNLFRAQRLIDAADLPDAEEKLEIFAETVRRLSAAGYVYIGLDHFALPDDALVLAQRDRSLQRNFQGYSTHAECDLLGLGLTAIGKMADGYSQNAKALADYYAAIDAGHLPIARGLRLSRDDRIRRAVIQALMCHATLPYADIEARFDIDFADYFARELAGLEPLAADGLVGLGNQEIRVTDSGRFFLRPIAMVFDTYLKDGSTAGRFSKAV